MEVYRDPCATRAIVSEGREWALPLHRPASSLSGAPVVAPLLPGGYCRVFAVPNKSKSSPTIGCVSFNESTVCFVCLAPYRHGNTYVRIRTSATPALLPPSHGKGCMPPNPLLHPDRSSECRCQAGVSCVFNRIRVRCLEQFMAVDYGTK